MRRSSRLASSAIAFAEFDDGEDENGDDEMDIAASIPRTGTLTVTFVNGGSYTYSDVSVEEYEALVGSASPGRHWWASLRGR